MCFMDLIISKVCDPVGLADTQPREHCEQVGPLTSFVPKSLLLGKCLAGAGPELSNKLLLSSKLCLR